MTHFQAVGVLKVDLLPSEQGFTAIAEELNIPILFIGKAQQLMKKYPQGLEQCRITCYPRTDPNEGKVNLLIVRTIAPGESNHKSIEFGEFLITGQLVFKSKSKNQINIKIVSDRANVNDFTLFVKGYTSKKIESIISVRVKLIGGYLIYEQPRSKPKPRRISRTPQLAI